MADVCIPASVCGVQIKGALLTWLQRDCVDLKTGLPSFLRNKLSQTLVAVLQVGSSLAGGGLAVGTVGRTCGGCFTGEAVGWYGPRLTVKGAGLGRYAAQACRCAACEAAGTMPWQWVEAGYLPVG